MANLCLYSLTYDYVNSWTSLFICNLINDNNKDKMRTVSILIKIKRHLLELIIQALSSVTIRMRLFLLMTVLKMCSFHLMSVSLGLALTVCSIHPTLLALTVCLIHPMSLALTECSIHPTLLALTVCSFDPCLEMCSFHPV